MILEYDEGNPELGLLLARLIAALDGPNPGEAIRSIVQTSANVVTTVGFVSPTDECPPYCLVGAGADSIVVIGGCTRMAHAVGTMGGYAGGLSDSVTSPDNRYFDAGAELVANDIVRGGLLNCSRLTLTGHSLGGAICELLLSDGRFASKSFITRAITFGAPKPGGFFLASQLNPLKLRRWMNADDPVPLLPPTTADTLTILLAYSSRAVSRFANFVQPGGGLEITADFVIRPAVLPSAASLNATASLVTWLLAIDGSSQSGHHILSYVGRLTTWVARNVSAPVVVLRGGPAQQPVRVNRRELTQQEARVVTAVSTLQERQNERGVSLPNNSVVHAVRQGTTWAIVFGDATVAVTPHRRTAQSVARELNAFLHRLQPVAIVDPSALLSTLSDYLQAASDPASGFIPTMNTIPPG